MRGVLPNFLGRERGDIEDKERAHKSPGSVVNQVRDYQDVIVIDACSI
jgi:hypothetical protein